MFSAKNLLVLPGLVFVIVVPACIGIALKPKQLCAAVTTSGRRVGLRRVKLFRMISGHRYN